MPDTQRGLESRELVDVLGRLDELKTAINGVNISVVKLESKIDAEAELRSRDKAEIQALRTDVKALDAEIETVNRDVAEIKQSARTARWILGVLIAAAPVLTAGLAWFIGVMNK